MGSTSNDRARLERLRQMAFDRLRCGATSVADGVAPGPPTGLAPLSSAQSWLWFHHHAEPESSAYNMWQAYHLRGAVSSDALRRCFARLVARHSVFRTGFVEVDGRPVQRVVADAEAPFEDVDLSSLPSDERAERARAWILRWATRPFDLSRPPLLRGAVCRLAPDRAILALATHHIICDGFSARLLRAELSHGLFDGAPPLPEPPFRYHDYCRWQQDRLASGAYAAQLEYWRRRLEPDTALELPVSRPRGSAVPTAGHLDLTLDGTRWSRLRHLGERHGATVFAALAAWLGAFLTRLGRVPNVHLATQVAGRDLAGADQVIGLFLNTLVLPVCLRADDTFVTLLRRVGQEVMEALEHKDVPFDLVVADLRSARHPWRRPLADVMLVLQPPASVAGAGAALELFEVDVVNAKCDLLFNFREDDGRLTGVLEYNADLFDDEIVASWRRACLTLLDGLLGAPELAVAEVPLVATADWAAAITRQETRVELPAELTLPELCRRAARQRPDAEALRSVAGRLTFAELDDAAGRLASYLLARRPVGAGAGSRVIALGLPRSADLVVSALAILKVGLAYLPLDPRLPRQRLETILADAAPELVLFNSGGPEVIRAVVAPDRCIDLDAVRDAVAATAPLPAPLAEPDDPAYLLYTSGSSGVPKGVINTHAGIVNRILWAQGTDPLHTTDRLLQKTPDSFDVSVWELFWPLVAGSVLVLARPDGERDPTYLADLIQREEITHVHFVPSMLDAFLREPRAAHCRTLIRVICSGEELPEALQHRFFQVFPDCELYNLYGPTEAAVEVTAWRCRRGAVGPVPIGWPVWNTRIYLLDERSQPVPDGTIGELYIAGRQVAAGYLNRPDLTADAFPPDPWSVEPGARMFRTRDLARRRGDGALVFEGRADRQIKVRGYRVENAEVEAHVRAHPGVRWAAAVGRPTARGIRLEVFYQADADLDEELRLHMEARVPEYMVPSLFHRIGEVPLTRSGKLDSTALLARPIEPPTRKSEVRALASPLQEQIARVWVECLRTPAVGPDDNFFSLGGHSLDAVAVVQRLRELGLPVSLDDLFRCQTVALLAEAVADRAAPAPADRAPAVARPAEEFPLSDQQAMMLEHYGGPIPDEPAYHYQQWVRFEGSNVHPDRLHAVLRNLVARHAIFRTQFVGDGDRPVRQRVRPAAPLPWRVEDRGVTIDAVTLQSLLIEDRRRPLGPHDPDVPPFRFAFLREGENTGIFLLSIHHALFDGWSNVEFFNQLVAGLAGAQAAPGGPDDGRVYRELIELMRAAETDDRSARYWREVSQAVQAPRWPAPVVQGRGDEFRDRLVPGDVARRVAEAARGWHVTAKAVYLWAWGQALAPDFGGGPVAVATVSNGRSDRLSDPFRPLGLFWHLAPVVLRPVPGSVAEQVQAVQGHLLDADRHGPFPCWRLLRAEGRAEAMGVSFNYIHFPHGRQGAWPRAVHATASGSYDRFHPALNLVVRTDPADGCVHIRCEYDPKRIGYGAVGDRLDGLMATLATVAIS